MRIPKPCKDYCCNNLTTMDHGYCDDHKHLVSHWRQYHASKGGNTTARGYGSKWRRLRKVIIRRDNGLCQECQRQGRVTAGTDVDHIIPKSAGGTDDQDNLELLCGECHANKTNTESNL